MINLLPINEQKEYRAAKRNVVLRNYLLLFILLGATIGVILTGGWWLLNQAEQNAKQQLETNQQKIKNYAKVQSEAKTAQSAISQAKKILDQQFAYSQILLKIAEILPPDVSINNLNLDSELFKGEVNLNFEAQNQQAILNTKKALEESDLFKSVKIHNILVNFREGATIQAEFAVKFDKKGLE